MKQLTIMIKPASSLCNLRCKYCFYADISSNREVGSHGIMTLDTADCLIEWALRDMVPGDRLDFVFQGGEPTLAGLNFFLHFTEKVCSMGQGISVSYAIQTNGILLDETWAAFLAEHRFLVGLSLDGPAEYHNTARVDPAGRGTFKQVMSARKLLERYKIPYNVLMVLTRHTARHPQVVWKFLRDSGIEYVQFIPCLEPLDALQRDPFALSPELFASFYTTLFSLWFEDMKKGQYLSIKLFDDIVNQLAFCIVTACGQDGRCSPQLVVEADGSVYPCDFYALDRFCMGNLSQQPLKDMLFSSQAELFRQERPLEPPLCHKCRYRKFCGNGCKRMRRAVFCGMDECVCGYQMFLDCCFDSLYLVARMQQRLRGGLPPRI